MRLFLGYDPGGRGKNGVAATYVSRDGLNIEPVSIEELADACSVLQWIEEFRGQNPAALAIDTLLGWSLTGSRTCDARLRQQYLGRGGRSVVDQNSLYSAMTINGTIVALKAGLPICECHPKLLLSAGLLPGSLKCIASTIGEHRGHASDALIAAWAASRWHYGAWTNNLFENELGLIFPTEPVEYPWQEAVATVVSAPCEVSRDPKDGG